MNKNSQDLISNIQADDAKRAEQEIPIQNDLPAQAILEKCLDIEDCVEQTYEKITELNESMLSLQDRMTKLESSLEYNRKQIAVVSKNVEELKTSTSTADENIQDLLSSIESKIHALAIDEELDSIAKMLNYIIDAIDDFEENDIEYFDNAITKINANINSIVKTNSNAEVLENIEKYHVVNLDKYNILEKNIYNIEKQIKTLHDETESIAKNNNISKNLLDLEHYISTSFSSLNRRVDSIDNRDIYEELKYINKNIINNNYDTKIDAINKKLDSTRDLLQEIKSSDKFTDEDLDKRVKSIEKLIRTIVNSLGKG